MLNNDLSYEAGLRVYQCERFAEERLNREAAPLWRNLSVLPDPLQCEELRSIEEPYIECAREMLYAFSRELPGPSDLMNRRLRKRVQRIIIMVVDRWKQHRDARFGGRYCCETFDLQHLETRLTNELTRIADAVVDTIVAAEENRYGPGYTAHPEMVNPAVTEGAPRAPTKRAIGRPEANGGAADSTGAQGTSAAVSTRTRAAKTASTPVDDRLHDVKLLIRKMRAEGLPHREICERLGNNTRPRLAEWRDLSWPKAYLKHTKAVCKWISKASRG